MAKNVVITTAFRSRVKDENKAIANIGKVKKFDTEEEFFDFWKDKISGIGKKDYVKGAGEHGIFAPTMLVQAENFGESEDFYAISMGVGLVSFEGQYPQYDLGEFETNLASIVPSRGGFSYRNWWSAMTEHYNESIADVVSQATDDGNRVIIAIPGTVYSTIKDDIENIIPDGDDKKELIKAFEKIRKHLRFVGPELENVVHPDLIDCVMPWDKAKLNDVVPGANPNGARRLAFLMTKVCGKVGTDPADDYDAVQKALDNEEDVVFEYNVATQADSSGSKLERLDDDEARELIMEKYYKRCHGQPIRISRMMRHDGYSMPKDRVEELLGAPSPKAKSSKKSSPPTPKAKKGKTDKTKKPKAAKKKEELVEEPEVEEEELDEEFAEEEEFAET